MSVCNCNSCKETERRKAYILREQKRFQYIKKLEFIVSVAERWVKDSNHRNGCVRRNQPYPLRNKKEVCDCRRKFILDEIKAIKEKFDV